MYFYFMYYKFKIYNLSLFKHALRSNVRQLFRHLREINTDLGLWLDKGDALKEELKSSFFFTEKRSLSQDFFFC